MVIENCDLGYAQSKPDAHSLERQRTLPLKFGLLRSSNQSYGTILEGNAVSGQPVSRRDAEARIGSVQAEERYRAYLVVGRMTSAQSGPGGPARRVR